MKVMLTRMVVLGCVLLCATGVRAQLPNPVALPAGPTLNSGAIAADFNGDGRADLVTISGTVLLGNADGTFTTSTTVSLGNTSQNCPKPTCPILFTVVAVGDFNGDGKPDILVQMGPPTSTGIFVFLGKGDGTFGAPISSNPGASLNDLQVADVNGDGKLDLVFISFNQGNGQFFVSLGSGDGAFGTSTPITAAGGTSFGPLLTGDFNGDGKVDIAAAGGIPNGVGPVVVLFGNGDGTFATSGVTSTGVNAPIAMATADFNGDGKLDLVLTGERLSDHTQQTYFLPGNGNGTFQTPTIIAPGSGSVSVGDLNGDGKLDVVVWARPFVEVLLGNGNGTFQQKATYVDAGGLPVAIGDFNGDGKLDISDGHTATFGNGDGTFQNIVANLINFPPGSSPALSTVATGDFNGDGKTDLAVGLSGVAPSIYVLLGDGTGKYTIANVYTISSSTSSLLTADFNHDGKTDLAFNTLDAGTTVRVQVMLGQGDGSFAGALATTLGPGDGGLPLAAIEVTDFNGDGFPDVATIQSGELAVLIGVGDGTFSAPVSYFSGQSPTSFGLGDFNGDGKVDASLCNGVGNALLFGKGDGTFNTAIIGAFSSSSDILGGSTGCTLTGVADLNNDGLSDLLLNGTVMVSNGDGTFTPTAQFGLPSGAPNAAADMNGDGKLDLVASDGTTVFIGNGDGTFATQTVSLLPAWINPLIWANSNDQSSNVTNHAVFGVDDFNGTGLPGIAMIVQSGLGGEVSLPNPLPAPIADFVISAGIPGVVAPGGQITLTVKSKAIAGFNRDVALACDALPAGLTCSFAPTTIAAGTGRATVTIAVSSSATVGSYPFSLSGSAGALSHNFQRAITIASAAGATNADLRPLSLNFAAQAVGSAATQTATLSNGGAAPLQISSVSINGTNASDFSVSSNNCGTSLAAFTNCQIVVAFSPTATGVRLATLMVSDNATGGLQVVNLSGRGQDFGVGAASGGGTATVTAGKTATYPLSVASSVGFSGNVSLSCSGAPTEATCAITPATVTLSSGSAVTATVTVTTTARSELAPPSSKNDDLWTPGIFGSPRIVATYATAFALWIGIMVIFGGRRRRISWVPVAAGVLLIAGLALGGCGGGSNGGGTTPPTGGSTTGTPAGSYTITVTATAGSGANAVSHKTNLTLIVQ